MANESKQHSRRGLLGSVALAGLAGCGYLLYPQRSGRRGGVIDGGVLIVDLIWLLPGLIPGIICLVVDFSTGCIYAGGDGRANAPPADASQNLAVAVHVDGAVHATSETRPDGRVNLVWTSTPDLDALRERGRLVVERNGARAEGRLSELL